MILIIKPNPFLQTLCKKRLGIFINIQDFVQVQNLNPILVQELGIKHDGA
jgi:hypothetical protein